MNVRHQATPPEGSEIPGHDLEEHLLDLIADTTAHVTLARGCPFCDEIRRRLYLDAEEAIRVA